MTTAHPPLREQLDRTAAVLIAAAPANWMRIVQWAGRLLDDDGSTAGYTDIAVAVTRHGEQLGQEYVLPPLGQGFDAVALDAACAGQPEEGWTVLRIELDRDGEQRFDFSHEEARPLDDSASDEFWQAVHEYLDRNRTEVEALAERLGAGGSLPGGAAGQRGNGVLGRMFGRT
jgi:hypothetical protein